MNHTRRIMPIVAIAILLIASTGLPQSPAGDDAARAEMKFLRAENRMLKNQIESLQEQLTAKNQPTTKSTKQSSPVSNYETMTFSIHEDNPDWWSDPSGLAFEIQLRSGIRTKYPRECPSAWLERNGHFIGKTIDWTLAGTLYETISEEAAGQRYYQALPAAKSMQKKAKLRRTALEHSIASAKGKSRIKFQNQLAVLDRQIRRHQSQIDIWKMLLDAKGGTIVTAHYETNIKVRMVLPGQQLSIFEKNDRVHIRGEIVTAGFDNGKLNITVNGEVWQAEIPRSHIAPAPAR